DCLLVTGPVTRNMAEPLRRTYEATPAPRLVVAAGDCAADGGLFAGSYAVVGGVSLVVPVDLHVAGCPPSPRALLEAFLALLAAGAAVPCSSYAIGYLDDRRGGLPGLGVAYAGFLASMALVPIAGNVLTFLVAWELSALSSYFLVMADPDDRGVPRAG